MVVKKIYVKMIRIILLLVAFASSEAKLFGFDNNACKNWSDYFTVNISPNCWYEPDVRATTVSMIFLLINISLCYFYLIERKN